jgi:hypothetical protein
VVTGAGAYTGGGRPDGKLVMDQAGNLYGSAEFDGDFGKVFEYDPITQAVTTIWLSNGTHHGSKGFVPQGIVFGKSGKLYGTTPFNKVMHEKEYGTIFSLKP